ncbi:MAG TPA: MXAN_5187 C-terminal domain-containing protein [Myxococcota bacterium]|nr:MXAN_5187 C-terminal domain-containing protein [Myxococcota bacterium]
MAEFGTNIDEDLQLLDARIKTLKLDYEQYFLGSRPRAPTVLRGDVQKMVAYYANVPIQNTAMRFKFNNLRSRYFTFRRHWDETLRKIEEGTYERHVFKADLHERERAERRAKGKGAPAKATAPEGAAEPSLFDAYRAAREECGQGTKGLTPEQFDKMLKTQEAAIREKYKCEKVNFRVVVEDGKTKLKASPVRK